MTRSLIRRARIRHAGSRRAVALLTATVTVGVLAAACGEPTDTGAGAALGRAVTTHPAAGSAHRAATIPTTRATPTPAPPISLGKGLLAFPQQAAAWVAAHPGDPRTPLLRSRIAAQPTALWLVGDDSFDNLRDALTMARATDRTPVFTLWNVPGRDDGLSAPSPLSLAAYRTWVTRVASTIGRTRAIVVLEPDALWFYDRLPSAAARSVRLSALRYAVDRLHSTAPNTRVYVDAGTASGSVTPARMATLLKAVGVSRAAGYAVDVSSYAPTATITAYAQQIRGALQHLGVADPRYVVDSGRNGAAGWDYTWCNPASQRLGLTPRLVRSTTGLDLDLWIKGPGTSDGDCGPAGGGAGTEGGEFLPALAYRMITG